MSFYGNVVQRLEKFFRFIKINDTTIDATEENDEIVFEGTNGINLSANEKTIAISGENLVKNAALSGEYNNDNYETVQALTLTGTRGNGTNFTNSVDIKIPKLAISEANDTTDNTLKYTITYGGKQIGIIDIPLDLILDDSKVIEKNVEFTGDDGEIHPAGTYLHLTFKSAEKTIHNYINVTDLNEIAGAASPTITVAVNNNQITANVKSSSITDTYLADDAVITAKIADKAITAAKIADNTITATQIASNAITSSELAEGAVNTLAIQDGAVTEEKFDDTVRYFSTTDITTVNEFGGIPANTNLKEKTTHEILEMLLFPYIPPEIEKITCDFTDTTKSSFILEQGDKTEIERIIIEVVEKSNPLENINIRDEEGELVANSDQPTNGENMIYFSEKEHEISAQNNKLYIEVFDQSSHGPVLKTLEWTFVYPYYYGVCAADAIINEALVEGLTPKIENKSNKTDWSFTCTNQRMVFAYPKAYGVLKQIVDPNGFDITSSFESKEIQITGLDSTSQDYYVYVNNASTVSDFKIDFKY